MTKIISFFCKQQQIYPQIPSWKCNLIVVDILVTFLTAEVLSVRASYPGEVADKLLSDKGQDKKIPYLNVTPEIFAGNWTLQPTPGAMQGM